MFALKMKDVAEKQLSLAKELFGSKNTYNKLLAQYEKLYTVGLVTKHSTHDSVFFIGFEGMGFKATKFYEGGVDIRSGGIHPGMSEAYTEAIVLL